MDTFTGRCTCGEVHYRFTMKPLVVNCCHCRWCQRETGAAFALNAMIEMKYFAVTKGTPVHVTTPSNSGKGQIIVRCPACHVALWSHYAGAGNSIAFVRVGTLENPDACPPDVHIFTESKQPWVVFPAGSKVYREYYPREEVWSKESIARLDTLRGE